MIYCVSFDARKGLVKLHWFSSMHDFSMFKDECSADDYVCVYQISEEEFFSNIPSTVFVTMGGIKVL